ncbi:TIGR04282 family arsenosugar biosynthesis glycosyltransferase [Rivularia sp. UHCC 0363]|uniref:TIGR04282 family arsenosugar biosynthesis glycosyltransferase n=1 Tax=Rivularia sp. UHCC 0363 TaxID=3110244 RepID=UPI002B1FB79A|nr:TIGR04282 family arsenosugar biosynthesis glycosyltransferase [Rivularia sp. UHCC 0363]MEA5598954.1 TIGR04282 family arsenosugar biosynthesis glycosyltransferase [Rivularia sp. UHCC 0363]
MSLSPKITEQHLIIFTRYPEPGKTKTRLIPALGVEGAANLQRQMTEFTLSKVKKLCKSTAISFEVRFADGNLQLMQSWLGTELNYQLQGEGDLGKRMENSFLDAFNQGAKKVVIIGIDCPGVNAQILSEAFEKLQDCDLLLGPAVDGGYYLIGLKLAIGQLFTNIDWGTDRVLKQTVDIARQLNLSVTYLQTLADVDRPEDLAIWQNSQQ